ncbi:transketolase family protein [Butyrivibrio sp. AD3002]|uniref:transketolase family protein n=1 Tax=Butyrivibrio sp. AD3002 TaxID=1280670 RepID=UPI0003B63206|nr:transketolase C-terminal domain-containing protein [Butyrivibrio sp. AD3002]
MEYNKKNAKRWSILGERPTFGTAVAEFAKEDPGIIAVVADVTNSAGLSSMARDLPEQVINVGIAEQNMMGIATGLSSEGYTVFTSTFAPFQSMRCLEQIRVNQGYMHQKVIMAGLAGGVAYGELGFTHCTIEDVAIMRSIPNVAVVTPADCTEVVKIVEASIKYKDSVYIRLMDKTGIPVVYEDDYDFEIGKAVPIIKDGVVSILANGPVVYPAIQAARKYAQDTGKEIAVYDFHTVKPVDKELILGLQKRTGAILTIEEHSIVGGLGGAVAEACSELCDRIPIFKMGFDDEYPHGASHEALLKDYGLNEDGIYSRIDHIVKELNL